MKKNDKQALAKVNNNNKTKDNSLQIPPGLVKCPICGEYKGKTEAKNLNWDYPSGIDPDQIISVTCLCDGIICPKCHITKIHKPVSNQYDQETNTIWHSPWFAAQAGCQKCRDKNK